MIIATKSVDGLLRGIVAPENLKISKIDSIAEAITIDPSITQPVTQLYIVSNDDIKNIKVKKVLETAMASKHVDSRIIYVNKNGRNIPGITEDMFDAYLSKPTKSELEDKCSFFVKEYMAKGKFEAKDDLTTFEEYTPKDVITKVAPKEVVKEDKEIIDLHIEEQTPTIKVEDSSSDSDLLRRIRESEGNLANLLNVTNEVTASSIIKEVASVNATYRASENYITSISEVIQSVLCNPDYTTKDALSKVSALLHDKAAIKAKTNSIVEQSVEEIILAIVDKAKTYVENKTLELDNQLMFALKHNKTIEAPNISLANIIERRTRLLLELNTEDLEIKRLADICSSTVDELVNKVSDESVSATNSPIVDSQLKVKHGSIVPENLLNTLDNLFLLGKTSSEEFGKLSALVNSSLNKVYSILALYKEESEILGDTIRFLKANNVEDTVVANTILKKTNRLFINDGDFDSQALTYLISKNNSRKSSNVLLIDTSGSNVFELLGIPTIRYSDFMEGEYMSSRLLVISTYNDPGMSVSTIEDCQRLSTRLLHYAKHYSSINVMCNTKQDVLINEFNKDVLSITYLIDCFPSSIKSMKECISKYTTKNTASRVVLVNYLADSSSICEELGVLDRLDMQLAMIPNIPELRYCALHRQDPSDVDSIVDTCKEMLMVC